MDDILLLLLLLLLRLLEEPFLATTVQGVYLYLYFAVTCFGLRWPSSGGIYNILGSYCQKHTQIRLITKMQQIRCKRGNFPKYRIFQLKMASESRNM
jgi:hypothetical protein